MVSLRSIFILCLCIGITGLCVLSLNANWCFYAPSVVQFLFQMNYFVYLVLIFAVQILQTFGSPFLIFLRFSFPIKKNRNKSAFGLFVLRKRKEQIERFQIISNVLIPSFLIQLAFSFMTLCGYLLNRNYSNVVLTWIHDISPKPFRFHQRQHMYDFPPFARSLQECTFAPTFCNISHRHLTISYF